MDKTRVFSWGRGHLGQLGSPTASNGASHDEPPRRARGRSPWAWNHLEPGPAYDATVPRKMQMNLIHPTPMVIECLESANIVAIATGFAAHHAAAVSDVSEIYVWGRGDLGQLGLDKDSDFCIEDIFIETPRRLRHPALLHKTVRQICCGRDWTACLTEDGLYTWGSNAWNQLGHSTQNQLLSRMKELKALHVPTSNPPELEDWGGYWESEGIHGTENSSQSEAKQETGLTQDHRTTDGSADRVVMKWGSTEAGIIASPRLVEGILRSKLITHVACGVHHMACVTSDGDVYTWGYGERGVLGHPDRSSKGIPTAVEFFSNPEPGSNRAFIKHVSCGESHTVAVAANGHVYSWGEHSFGQLGIGPLPETPMQHSMIFPTPVLVSSMAEANITIVSSACGATHTLLLTDQGNVYSCGANIHGQLGLGTSTAFETVPCKIEYLKSEVISSIACGEQFSAAVTARGDLWTWGHGSHQALGHFEQVVSRSSPHRVETLTNVRQVACGSSFALALLGPPQQTLHKDMRKILFSKDFSDISLHGSNQVEIPAHKAIIAVRCPALLSAGNQTESLVSLVDIDEMVLRKLLEFIYTNDFTDLPGVEMKEELMKLAERLQYNDLISKCALLLGRTAGPQSTLRGIEDDLLQLLADPQFSDCTLRVNQLNGEQSFKCHRAVLSCRCPFFEAMLSADRGYRESKEATISLTMPDLFEHAEEAGDAISALLKWIYGEQFDPSPESGQLLLALADEYSLPQLAIKCEALIQEGVDASNVVEVLQFSEVFRANKLRRYCIEFMASPSFPAEALQNLELPPQVQEEVQARKRSWTDYSRQARLEMESMKRRQLIEEERKLQEEAYQRKDSPMFALAQLLRTKIQGFQDAEKHEISYAEGQQLGYEKQWHRYWVKYLSHEARDMRREARRRQKEEEERKLEAARLKLLEEERQTNALRLSREESLRRTNRRLRQFFLLDEPEDRTSRDEQYDDPDRFWSPDDVYTRLYLEPQQTDDEHEELPDSVSQLPELVEEEENEELETVSPSSGSREVETRSSSAEDTSLQRDSTELESLDPAQETESTMVDEEGGDAPTEQETVDTESSLDAQPPYDDKGLKHPESDQTSGVRETRVEEENAELARAIRLAEEAFELEKDQPEKADHLFNQSSISFLQALRVADEKSKEDVRNTVNSYIARIDERNQRRNGQESPRFDVEDAAIEQEEDEGRLVHSGDEPATKIEVDEEKPPVAPQDQAFLESNGQEEQANAVGDKPDDQAKQGDVKERRDSSESVGMEVTDEEVTFMVPEEDDAIESDAIEVNDDNLTRMTIVSEETVHEPQTIPSIEPSEAVQETLPASLPSSDDSSSSDGEEEIITQDEVHEKEEYLQLIAEEDVNTVEEEKAESTDSKEEETEGQVKQEDEKKENDEVKEAVDKMCKEEKEAHEQENQEENVKIAESTENKEEEKEAEIKEQEKEKNGIEEGKERVEDVDKEDEKVDQERNEVPNTPEPAKEKPREALDLSTTPVASPPASPRLFRPSMEPVSPRISSRVASRLAIFQNSSKPASPAPLTRTASSQSPRACSLERDASSPSLRSPQQSALASSTSMTTPSRPTRQLFPSVSSPQLPRPQSLVPASSSTQPRTDAANGAPSYDAAQSSRLSYARLKAKQDLPHWVDYTRLEEYLTDEEFQVVFKMPRSEFVALKPWRKQQQKKAVGLF